jgi:hypothetical protein
LRKTNEQPVLHDPGNTGKHLRHGGGIVNAPQRGVDDPVPAIRDKSMAVPALPQLQRTGRLDSRDGAFDRPPRGGKAEGSHLDRQREAAEHVDPFASIGDHDHPRGRCRHDLFPQQGAAATLDEAQIGGNFVGAVHRQIERRNLLQGGQWDAAGQGPIMRSLRGRHRDDVETAPHALAYELHKMPCRRSRAEPEPHAGTHKFHCPGGCGTFLVLGVHRQTLTVSHPGRKADYLAFIAGPG